jgi:TIR domain
MNRLAIYGCELTIYAGKRGGGPVMSKVFLAYKRIDLERANMVRTKLEALGVPLFIDQKQGAGENYIRTINEELNSAIAALVLWTKAAVVLPESGEPNFMLSEAQRGYSRGILITATFDKIVLDHLPVPFNTLQASDLSDWIEAGASARHPEWQKVLEAVSKKLGRPGLPDLAIALESGTDDLKRKFLKKYPADPAAQQITAFIEAYERKEFGTRLAAAQRRIQQRAKEAEKKLKSCRDEFESQIIELRSGRDFMPPDPSKALDDRVATLSTQIEIHESTIASERARAEQAEDSAAQAHAEVVALKDQLGKLGASAAMLDARNAAIEQLNFDLAKRDAQIASHESTIASQATELATLADAGANTRQASVAKDARIDELANAVTAHKRRQQTETQRLTLWSGVAALIAACVFTVVGWSMAPSGSTEPGTIVPTLNAKIASLSAQNKTLQTQADTAQHQATDAATQNQKLSALLADQSTQGAALKSQQDALSAKQTAFAKQQTDFAAQQAAFVKLRDDFNAQQASLSTKQTALATAQAVLTKQQSDLAAQQNALKLLQTTGASIPLDVQCDALAGYQYDPDRPQFNGWALEIKDIPATQAICLKALQTSGIDQITQRRMLVELARTFVESSPVDYNAYVDNLNKASRLGSSQADYQLGMYYASHNNPQLAWDKIQQSAAAHNPVALNRAAISQLLPEWNPNFITGRALDSGFRYLQQALDAAYFRSYYIAGAAYWTYKDRDTQDRSKAIYFLTVSQCVTDRRDPADKENYKDGADYYYSQKTGKHLTCPQ